MLKRPDAALAKLGASVREEAKEYWQAAAERGADLHPVNYLSMGARFRALRRLHRHLDLGKKEEHEFLRKVRNDAAHGHLDPYLGLRAIALGEWMLAQLSTFA